MSAKTINSPPMDLGRQMPGFSEPLSMETPVGRSKTDDDTLTLGALMRAPEWRPWESLDRDALIRLVLETISRLPEREQEILYRRMRGETLCEVGERMDLCRERVRQLQGGALRKLRRWLDVEDVQDPKYQPFGRD